ncbi:MAG: hypothetical protein HY323_01035 [Betaproteobacteria bacterium]|nr:hypothetical protein [Betaproteobacteria bacterium]
MQAVPETKAKSGQAAGKPEAKADAKPELQPLRRGDAALFEFTNNVWRIVAPVGVSAEQIDLHPTFFNLLGDELRMGDEVKVIARDRSWLAKFEILASGPGFVQAKLAYVMRVPLQSVSTEKKLPDGWSIVATDPTEPPGFVCVHAADGKKILDSGMPFLTHEDARRGLLDHAIFREETHTRYLP